MSNFNIDLERYISEVRRSVSQISKNEASSFVDGFQEEVKEYVEINSIESIDEIIAYFGEPEEAASSFISKIPSHEIKRVVSKKKLVRIVAIILVVIALIALGIFAFETFSKRDDGYFVDVITDNGNISSSVVLEEYTG